MATQDKRVPDYHPEPKEKEAIDLVMKDRDAYYEATRDYRAKWRESYDNYKMSRSESSDPYRANVFVPVTFWSVETIVPRLVGQNPTVTAHPVDEEDVPKARFLSRIIDVQWRKEMGMFDKVVSFAKSAALFGTGVMKMYWQGKADRPHADVLNLFDFYCNPLIPSIDEMPSVIHRSFVPQSSLTKEAGYKNMEFVSDSSPMKFSDSSDRDSDSIGHTDLNEVTTVPSGDLVEILEWWSDERVITVANPGDTPVLIRDMDNPFEHGKKPFVSYQLNHDAAPNRFYGSGIGDELLDIQDTVNTSMNQIIDNINLSINQMMKVRRGANIHPLELISRPGGVVHVDNLADIEPMVMPDRTGAAQQLQQQLLFYAQNMTGATDLARGLGATDTATGIAIRDKNVGTRFNLMLRGLEEAIEQMGDLIAKLDMQFLTEKKVARFDVRELTPDELELFPEIRDVKRGLVFVKFDKDDIKGNYDIEVNVDSTTSMDKGVLQKQLLDFLAIAGSDPNIKIRRKDIYERMLSFMGFSDAGNFFEEEEVPVPEESPGPVEEEIPGGLPVPGGSSTPVGQLSSVLQSGQQL